MNIESLLGNIAFPIFAFLLMYRLVKDSLASNTIALTKLSGNIQKLETLLINCGGLTYVKGKQQAADTTEG